MVKGHSSIPFHHLSNNVFSQQITFDTFVIGTTGYCFNLYNNTWA